MQHYYEGIGGWFSFREAFDAILAGLPSDRPSTVVELGTWEGKSTAYLGVRVVNSGLPVTLVAIDHFLGSPELMGMAALPTLEATFRRHLAPVAEALGERFQVIVGDSAGSAARFADAYIDAVWVDAAHEYEAVRADRAAWWPKVRAGGVWAVGVRVVGAGVEWAVSQVLLCHAGLLGAGLGPLCILFLLRGCKSGPLLGRHLVEHRLRH